MNTKELAQRWFEEIWNRKNSGVIHEMMHPEGVGRTEGGAITGPGDFEQQMFVPLNAAFPDLSVTLDGIISEGDDAVVRWTATGTNAGELLGIKATGRRLNFSGMTWLRFSEGRIVEGWDRWNLHGLLGLLQQGAPSATCAWVD